MKVFLTGATGFVGSFLAENLVKSKYKVKCLVRKKSNLRWIADLDVECFYGSLNDKDSLKRGIKDCEYVYHVAGVTKAQKEAEYYQGNYDGTRNLVDVCVENNNNLKRFVFVGSQAAVGPSPTIIPIDETHPPNPLTYYGKSKLAGEEYVRKNDKNIPVTIVRPAAVYGPRETDILEFFRTVKMGIIPQLGGKEKYLSLIHVSDLIRGIQMAGEAQKTLNKTYFLTNQKPYSWQEVAKATLKSYNKSGIRIPVPVSLMKIVAFISEGIATITNKPALVNSQKIIEMQQDYWTCSGEKAKKEFGFEANIGLEEGIQETIQWYKEHKWL